MKFFISLLMLSFSCFGMEAKIRCDQLAGNVTCKMAYQSTNFMDVNNKGVLFNHGSRCYDNSCDWIGFISPNILYEGTNHAEFNVRTIGSDPNAYAKSKYSFYFGGNYKDYFISTRRGFEVDQTSISFELSLQEIDPALYNEYLEIKNEFDSAVGDSSPKARYNKYINDFQKIRKEIQELTDLVESIKDKQFDEIDPATLEKLGIAENQIRLLNAKKEDLLQYVNQTEQTREQVQSQVIARYEAIRARARTYDSHLPDLPVRPNIINPEQFKISNFVHELHNELVQILSRVDDAVAAKNFKKFSDSLKDWKRSSDHSVEIYSRGSDINAAEKELLFNTIYEGSLKIFNGGVSNDSWRKTNTIPENIRKTVDGLTLEGYEEASDLRDTLNFTKINPNIETDVKLSLAKSEQLANKLNSYNAQTDWQRSAKNIASASLKINLSSINDAIKTDSKEPLSFADKAADIGLAVLDIGVDFIPGISTARSAIELFTGKNIVTGEEFTKLDYSMAFVGLFTGLVGFNVSKVAFEPATELVAKFSKKLNLAIGKTAKEVSDNLPQVENLLQYYRKLKKPIAEIATSDTVNKYLLKMYPGRFTKPSFAGSKVLGRLTEAGEHFCRVVMKKVDRTFQIVPDGGGIFTFRCEDILGKSIKEIFEMAAIPNTDTYEKVFVAKIIPPIKTSTWEGIAANLDDKLGGGLQIFLDVSDPKEINRINTNPIIKELKDVFTGF